MAQRCGSDVLITGDDFGESHRVNEAVERDYEAGFLRQASLLVGGQQVDEAVRIARRNPGLDVGLHLAVTESAPLTRSSLLGVRGGLMDNRPHAAGLRYAFCSPRLKAALEAEVRLQFHRFVELGFEPVYFDGHMHLHLHPAVWTVAREEALSRGFRAFRTVREGTTGLTEGVFRALSARAVRSLPPEGDAITMRTADASRGLRRTCRLGNDAVERWAAEIVSGPARKIYEWIYHPGKEPQGWNAVAASRILERREVPPRSWRQLVEAGI
jgi:predicted glycoside hydrolase/deacetylase ChbG (UPF0249 family)